MNKILQDIVKPVLERLIQYIDTNNYWKVYCILIGLIFTLVLLGFLISWFLHKKKLKREIEKISIESKEKLLSILEKLQSKRNNYIRQSELIQLSVKLCIDSLLQKDKNELKKNREELIDLYFNIFVNSFIEYIEICEIYYKGEKQKILSLIKDEIIPFLETTKIFLSTVNNENILAVLQLDKVAMKKFTLNPIINFSTKNISILNWKLKKKLKKIVNEIDFEKTT